MCRLQHASTEAGKLKLTVDVSLFIGIREKAWQMQVAPFLQITSGERMLATHTRCCLLMARPTPMQVLLSTSVPTPTASSAPPALPTPCAMALFIPLFAVCPQCADLVAHTSVRCWQITALECTATSHTGYRQNCTCNSVRSRALVDALGTCAERKPPITSDRLGRDNSNLLEQQDWFRPMRETV